MDLVDISKAEQFGETYDVLIIGAGPAGLFAALELMGKAKVGIIDAGKPLERKSCPLMTIDKCTSCKPVCHILGGFGGAQFFQGTKLARYPAGESLLDFIDGRDRLEEMYDNIDDILERHGKLPRPTPDQAEVDRLKAKANGLGLEFKYYNSQKVSQFEMNSIGKSLASTLSSNGVAFHEKQIVSSITQCPQGFSVTTKKVIYRAKRVVLALGRVGSRSMLRIADGMGLQYDDRCPDEIEVGVRVEVPYHVFDSIDGVHNDLKLKKSLGNHGSVKTFCQEYRGFLTKCCFNLHGDSSFSTLDGYIIGTNQVEPERRSQLSNLGIHHKFNPGLGLNDAYEMVRSISAQKQPIIQSMRGFLNGFADDNFAFKPSMPDAEVANINEFLPKLSTDVIKGFIHTINQILPGLSDDGNIVYAPSFELGAVKMTVSKEFESTIPGVYIGGDACGHFRGAMQAMASGIVIGKSIQKAIQDGKHICGSEKPRAVVHG